MNIKEVLNLKINLTKFYCEYFNMYLRLDTHNEVKMIYVSDTLENISDSSCPLLEEVFTLDDIFNMEVEPIETLSISDILHVDNENKAYYSSKLRLEFLCRLAKVGANFVPRLFVINPITHMLTDDLIEDTYELIDIANAKFVEVI